MRVATVDIGTNTVLLLVAERSPDGALGSTRSGDRALLAIEERATITRLGQGVDRTRALAPEAIARTNACLDEYAAIVRSLGAERVAVVGTSAMRDAGGGEAVRAHVRERFGVEARTISGDEEARLTYRGALSGLMLWGRDVVVFDIGGGSTEVVWGRGDALEWARSFDVGSVRMTERHVNSDPPSPEARRAIFEAAHATFASVPRPESSAPVVGIAGTVTTLAAVSLRMEKYDGARVHGMTLVTAELERIVDELAGLPLEQRKKVPGLEPKRADVIVAGGLVALAFLSVVAAPDFVVSDRGVRWGLAEELANA